eukprot:3193628-Alexandrium_andersonii.AAC.1
MGYMDGAGGGYKAPGPLLRTSAPQAANAVGTPQQTVARPAREQHRGARHDEVLRPTALWPRGPSPTRSGAHNR